jgi:hypothetical protein
VVASCIGSSRRKVNRAGRAGIVLDEDRWTTVFMESKITDVRIWTFGNGVQLAAISIAEQSESVESIQHRYITRN